VSGERSACGCGMHHRQARQKQHHRRRGVSGADLPRRPTRQGLHGGRRKKGLGPNLSWRTGDCTWSSQRLPLPLSLFLSLSQSRSFSVCLRTLLCVDTCHIRGLYVSSNITVHGSYACVPAHTSASSSSVRGALTRRSCVPSNVDLKPYTLHS
jgi:hypothetical protein